ncbi:cache domain-containing sensor histidine kinase [Paenibacillus sp. B01]|uniref:cache domain-containing sensor histidine kinase n=1 Tax=Paenibacillus sp. B01 TaxID=2660554 RepID=UPI00129B4558|nr:sensor histidine kinase [Paenibacillus sp. B01]QGG56708.1 HAMP domain-containing protein [Paenibacillus sp. B01]
MNPFRKHRVDKVFLLSFAAFIGLLVTVIMAVSYQLSAREQATSASAYQQAMLQQLNKQLTDQMDAVEQTALFISLNAQLASYLTSKGDYFALKKARDELNRDYLAPILNSSRSIFTFQVYMNEPLQVDPNAAIQYLPLSQARSESWHAAVEKADSVWVGQRAVGSPQGEQQAVSFIRRINTPEGVNLGLLVLNVRMRFLQSILTEDNSSASRLLLDSGGRMIMHANRALPPGEIEALQQQVRGDAGHARQRLAAAGSQPAKDMLTVWSRTTPNSWMLVELTPWKEITGGSVRLAWTLAGVGAAAILLALVFTLYLSRSFTRPIRQLVQLMKSYAPGRPARPPQTEYRNEFGSLFGGYRKLTERIEGLYQSLEQQHRAQRRAEIRALQAAINPHFLYNTLDQLNWMAIEAGQEKISHVVELMGRMFRISLSGGETMIPLQEELLLVESYLGIQQAKWRSGLEYRIEIAGELRELLVPKLTLQPFVENAIVHGFHGSSRGLVTISGEQHGSGMRLVVQDDGIGLRDDWQARKRTRTGGYGVRNVKERIEVLFGRPYGVELRSLPERKGTRVEIYLPSREDHGAERGEPHVDDRDRG